MNYLNCNLDDLRLFLNLIESCSLSDTAAKFHVSISACSRRLQKLRDSLPCGDDPLFIKSGYRFMPTEWSLRIRPKLEALLNQAEETFKEDIFVPEKIDAEIVIAANDYACVSILRKPILEVCRKSPKVRFRLVSSPENIIESLRNKQVHLAINPLADDELPSDIRCLKLYPAKFSILVRSQHPLVDLFDRNGVITEDDLKSYKEILYKPMSDVTPTVHKESSVAIWTTYQGIIPYYLEQSDLIYIGPTRLCREFSQRFDLTMLPLSFTIPSFMRKILWHESVNLSPQNQWIRSFIASYSKLNEP